VAHPSGQRALLFAEECGWSAPGLCSACDERLLPELESVLEVWYQLTGMATVYRGV
jgi:hypothetical protein